MREIVFVPMILSGPGLTVVSRSVGPTPYSFFGWRESVGALGGSAVGIWLILIGARLDLGAVWTKVVKKSRPFVLSSPSIRSTFDRATLAIRVENETSRLAVYQGQVDLDDRSLTGDKDFGEHGGDTAYRCCDRR